MKDKDTLSKFGKILKERELTYQQFAEMMLNKNGYFVHLQNISAYATGYKPIATIKVAKAFADTLEVAMEDIV
jgi:Zn-dependent membrane protease YugP